MRTVLRPQKGSSNSPYQPSKVFRHSSDIVGHEQSPLVGSNRQYGRVIQTSESLMSCPEINKLARGV